MSGTALCIFGEVLFDHFPDGQRVLGGAPFNVAWHLQAFGQAPRFISRVGDDPQGAQIRAAMSAWGMDLKGLQIDPQLPSGRVDIRFPDGEPDYDIVHPCAWDRLQPDSGGADCGLLYHGSLALRDEVSREALQRIREHGPQTVFVDVNLRPPWWQPERVATLLHHADWVKLNADELARLSAAEGAQPDAAGFLARHRLRGLIVTHGAAGAELLTADGGRHSARPARNIDVIDTVGAGDAFASVIILGLVSGWPHALTLQRAQAFAARVVGIRGAITDIAEFYRSLAGEWQLTV